MKFPSLQALGLALKKVLLRFPLEIAFALTGTIAASVLIELSNLGSEAENFCIRLIMVANLGLVLALSGTLFSESRIYSATKKNLLRLLTVLLVTGFFFLLDPLKSQADILRYFLLALAFHLLVSFAAFTGRNNINAFWHFNKTIFLRFLTGGLYSAVLFVGLAAALGSMNLLFNFKFEWDTFAILWVWIAGIFQTLFFLSGVPEDINSLEEDKSYPKGLKIFTQFVLIPLATVYVVILLAYEIRILIEWELPKGLVSSLILGYAVFGILSLLLVFPIRNLEENRWIKSYSRSFYFLLIPLIFLLILAVTARVIDYGITEERYILIVLAVWLSFISIYFLFSKRHDIRMIPVSLSLITLFTIYGPQGAVAISKDSQIRQLKKLFGKYDAYRNSGLQALTKPVDTLDRERMVNILGYLIDRHGLSSIKSISPVDPEKIERHFVSRMKPDSIYMISNRGQIRQEVKDSLLRKLNIPAGTELDGIETKGLVRFKIKNKKVVDISGYKRMISINSIPEEDSVNTSFNIDGKIYKVKSDTSEQLIVSDGTHSVSFDMKQHLRKLLGESKTFQKNTGRAYIEVPDEKMIVEKNLDQRRIRLVLYQMEGGLRRGRNKDLYILNYNGVLLVP